MYITLFVVFCRFDLELYETFSERDIDSIRDCFRGEPDPVSPGIRGKYQ